MPRDLWFRKLFSDSKEMKRKGVEFEVHTYRYNCPKWYGSVKGTRSVALQGEQRGAPVKLTKILEEDAIRITGASSCSVTLLQTYMMTISNIQPRAALGLGVHSLSGVLPSSDDSSYSAPCDSSCDSTKCVAQNVSPAKTSL